MPELLNVGVVGLGKTGLLHAAIFNRILGSKLVSVAEKDGIVRSFASKLLGNVKVYGSHSEMIEKESLDAIVITTPTFTHSEIAKEALRRKISVFCEKPLALDYAESSELAGLASGTGSMVGFQKRFIETFMHARELVAEGSLGSLRKIEAYAYLDDVSKPGRGWRFDRSKGGGALMELGVHLVDMLNWFFQDVRILSASHASPVSKTVDDTANVAFDAHGIQGNFVVSWSRKGFRLPELGIAVSGEKGSVFVTESKLILERPSGKKIVYRAELEKPVDYLLAFPEFYREDSAFAEAVLKGKESLVPFSSGAAASRIIDGIRAVSKAEGGND